ncbi:MAG: G protein-coupled receptor LGR4 [Planctomycetaceae bacterium]|nr:MAG: G protein-coupled receptor LGR4 [Planctomycetaceae bacterium]
MKSSTLSVFLILIAVAPLVGLGADPDLSKVSSRADLDSIIATTTEAPLKQALTDHADAILAAAKRYPHVVAIIRTIESAPGKFEKVNTTPEALKTAAGGDIPIFDTLTLVNTKVLGGGAHDHRKKNEDPYNAAFIEHLGQISSLETLYLEATNIEDSWVAPVLHLKKLKKLTIIGFGRLGDASLIQLQNLTTACPDLAHLELVAFGKATDAGLEKLAGLKKLETFAFRTPVKGHGFAKFEGWTRLRSINFHSNNLDDEGLGYVCENFPNLEFIKLWHSHGITDASAGHLGKLSKLKGMEIGCHHATAALLQNLKHLPMEYLGLSYGVNSPPSEAIAAVKAIPTLRRLSIQCDSFTDEELAELAGVTQLEKLTLNRLPLTEARIARLKDFAFLKELELAERRKEHHYPEAIQAKVKAALPNLTVTFIQ